MTKKLGKLEGFATIAIGLGLALLINCGGDDDSSASFAPGGSFDGGPSSSSSGGSSGIFGDGGSTARARGVLLVHAAGFPSMRLCFSGYPDILPQPDRRVLPQANVVGIELGGVVRLGPMLEAPGDVVVIKQQAVVAVPGKDEMTCAQYLKARKGEESVEWWKAGTIETPVGIDHAEVIAITGCGSSNLLTQLKIPASEWQRNCGDDYTGDKTATGTFATKVFAMTSTNTTTATSLPMTLVNMAPLVQPPAGRTLDVTFGDFDAGATAKLATPIPVAPALYTEGPSVTLNVDQGPGKDSTFGLTGFRIAYRDGDGGAPLPDEGGGLVVDQSLAAIQASSRADGNPTTYYVAPSNFAFFLLGDPRMQATVDGGANPDFDARRAVHLLAIPVLDESEAEPLGGDAGALAPKDAGPTDAGDAGQK